MIDTSREFEDGLFRESALASFEASVLVSVLLFLILVRPSLVTRRTFQLYGESFHHLRLNQLDDNRTRSYHYQIYAPPLGCLDPILG
jgi:hypothetical protein